MHCHNFRKVSAYHHPVVTSCACDDILGRPIFLSRSAKPFVPWSWTRRRRATRWSWKRKSPTLRRCASTKISVSSATKDSFVITSTASMLSDSSFGCDETGTSGVLRRVGFRWEEGGVRERHGESAAIGWGQLPSAKVSKREALSLTHHSQFPPFSVSVNQMASVFTVSTTIILWFLWRTVLHQF